MKIALGTKPNNTKHAGLEIAKSKLYNELYEVVEESCLLARKQEITPAIQFLYDVSVGDVVCQPVGSIVPEQPWGINITRTGAEYRAKEVQHLTGADICIGVENGVWGADTLEGPEFEAEIGNTVYIDAAWICILFQGRSYHATSEGIVFPSEYVMEAKTLSLLDPDITVGKVIAKHLHCDHADPHLALTNGLRSRKDILASAFYTALLQLSMS